MTLSLILVEIMLALSLGPALGIRDTDESLCDLKRRIKELGEKSTQILIFLSFAIAAAVFLRYGNSSLPIPPVSQRVLQSSALKWWVAAIFPVIVAVLPLKEFNRDNPRWYRIVRWSKYWLIWAAIADIAVGAIKFFLAL